VTRDWKKSRTTRQIAWTIFVGSFLCLVACAGPQPNAADKMSPSPIITEPATTTTVESATSVPLGVESPTPSTTTVMDQVSKTDTLDLVSIDGFKASVSISWHKIRDLTLDDFTKYHFCMTGDHPDTSTIFQPNSVVKGTVVDVSGSFPSVNGFVWPKSGVPIGVAGAGCAAQVGANGVNSDPGIVFVTPSSNEASFLVYSVTQKTPNNPGGDIKGKFGGSVSITRSQLSSCTIEGHPETTLCQSDDPE